MREKIREIILEVAEKYGVKVDRIILFGSRARGITGRIPTGIF